MTIQQIIDQITYHSQHNTQKRKAFKKLYLLLLLLFLSRKIILPNCTGHLLIFQSLHKIPLNISIGDLGRKT